MTTSAHICTSRLMDVHLIHRTVFTEPNLEQFLLFVDKMAAYNFKQICSLPIILYIEVRK